MYKSQTEIDCSGPADGRCDGTWGRRTVIDVDVWPECLALADHSGFAAVQRRLDDERNLLRVRVLQAMLSDHCLREAIDRPWENNVGPDVTFRVASASSSARGEAGQRTFFVCLEDSQIDVTMRSVGFNIRDLLEIRVVIDDVCDAHTLRLLTFRQEAWYILSVPRAPFHSSVRVPVPDYRTKVRVPSTMVTSEDAPYGSG